MIVLYSSSTANSMGRTPTPGCGVRSFPRTDSYSIMMEEDMENGRSYQERPRTFSTVRSKSSIPLVWSIAKLSPPFKYINELSGYFDE